MGVVFVAVVAAIGHECEIIGFNAWMGACVCPPMFSYWIVRMARVRDQIRVIMVEPNKELRNGERRSLAVDSLAFKV